MIRTRFAPSPTGFLHVGGARTALFSYLVARQNQGHFVLRIEDTDRERSTPESVDAILQGIKWLDLEYDEGPFYQTHRFDRYREVAQQLLHEHKAYLCDCSKERLDQVRAEQMEKGEKPRYDGHCRSRTDINPQLPHVVRFKNPESGNVTWKDLVKGEITFSNSELDDLIIIRSDSAPTYNFTVVVDDYDMDITHVVRGDDHVNNTPRQINILKALGKPLPQYAHVPMILGPDGKRLSKRHGAESVMQYCDEGYLPQALLNYLFRLGFAFGDQEVFTREEMIKCFKLDNVSGSPAIFDTQKLNWLNQQYMKTLPLEEIIPHLYPQFAALGLSLEHGPSLKYVYPFLVERASTLKELAMNAQYFYSDTFPIDEKGKKQIHPESIKVLSLLKDKLIPLKDFTRENITVAMKNVMEELNLGGMGLIGMPLRFVLTGSLSSPPIDITAELIGKERCLKRIAEVLT